MILWRYKAADSLGRLRSGRLLAENRQMLSLRLQQQGLDLIAQRRVYRVGLPGRNVGRRDLIAFCFQMEQNCRAGLPLLEGLRDLRDSPEQPQWQPVCAELMDSISEGKTLSEAMQGLPSVFHPLFVQLLRAGELSGDIAFVFRELGQALKWRDEQSAQLRRLLLYPVFLCVVIGFTLGFLMWFLVPELVRFASSMNQDLPWYTQWLIALSDGCARYWHWLLSLLVLLILAGYAAFHLSAPLRLRCDRLLLILPLVGPLLKKLLLARISVFFAMLYSAGITIVECLASVQHLSGNRALSEAVHRARQQVADGRSLHHSLREQALFPALFVRMVQVGESTGTLEEAMRNINYFYSRDVRESMDRLHALVEPLMTLLLGAVVAAIMFSVLAPIYEIIASLHV